MTTNEAGGREFSPQEKLAAALVAALAEMPEIGTDKKADLGKYKIDYLRLPTLLKHVKPILAKHGLGIVQQFNGDKLQTTLIHAGGAVLTSEGAPVAPNPDPKKWGANASYARRYALCAMCGIAPDPDVDGDALQPAGPPAGGVADAPSAEEVEMRIAKGFEYLNLTQQQRKALREQHQRDPDGLLRRLLEMVHARSAGVQTFPPTDEGREQFDAAVDATADAAVQEEPL